jgi:hypothetical protein
LPARKAGVKETNWGVKKDGCGICSDVRVGVFMMKKDFLTELRSPDGVSEI